jgi:hypothetical protein
LAFLLPLTLAVLLFCLLLELLPLLLPLLPPLRRRGGTSPAGSFLFSSFFLAELRRVIEDTDSDLLIGCFSDAARGGEGNDSEREMGFFEGDLVLWYLASWGFPSSLGGFSGMSSSLSSSTLVDSSTEVYMRLNARSFFLLNRS